MQSCKCNVIGVLLANKNKLVTHFSVVFPEYNFDSSLITLLKLSCWDKMDLIVFTILTSRRQKKTINAIVTNYQVR